jgi:hypothetical protein
MRGNPDLACDLTLTSVIISGCTWVLLFALPNLTAYCYFGFGVLTGLSHLAITVSYHATTSGTGDRIDLLGIRYTRLAMLVSFMLLNVLALQYEHRSLTFSLPQQLDGAPLPTSRDDNHDEEPQRASRLQDVVRRVKQTFVGTSVGTSEDTESLLGPHQATTSGDYGLRDPGHAVRQPWAFSFPKSFAKSTGISCEEDISPSTNPHRRTHSSRGEVSNLRLEGSETSFPRQNQQAQSTGSDNVSHHTSSTFDVSEASIVLDSVRHDRQHADATENYLETASPMNNSFYTAMHIGPKKTKFREELSDIGESPMDIGGLIENKLENPEDEPRNDGGEVAESGIASTSYVRNVVAKFNAHAGSNHSNDQADDLNSSRQTSCTYNQRNVSGSSVRFADENHEPGSKGTQKAVNAPDPAASVSFRRASGNSLGRSISFRRKSSVPSDATISSQNGDPLAVNQTRASQILVKRQRAKNKNRRQQARSDPTSNELVKLEQSEPKPESNRNVSAPGGSTVSKKRRSKRINKSRQTSGDALQGESSAVQGPPGTWIE